MAETLWGWGLRRKARRERCDVGHQLAPRSVKPLSPAQFEFCTLSPPPLGRMIGGCAGWSEPSGRIQTAASLKSLARRLVSPPLGSLPRVAGREMEEVAETGELFCEPLNSHMRLTGLHCDAGSPLPAQHTVWLSHLSAAVCWASLLRNKTKTPRNS